MRKIVNDRLIEVRESIKYNTDPFEAKIKFVNPLQELQAQKTLSKFKEHLGKVLSTLGTVPPEQAPSKYTHPESAYPNRSFPEQVNPTPVNPERPPVFPRPATVAHSPRPVAVAEPLIPEALLKQMKSNQYSRDPIGNAEILKKKPDRFAQCKELWLNDTSEGTISHRLIESCQNSIELARALEFISLALNHTSPLNFTAIETFLPFAHRMLKASPNDAKLFLGVAKNRERGLALERFKDSKGIFLDTNNPNNVEEGLLKEDFNDFSGCWQPFLLAFFIAAQESTSSFLEALEKIQIFSSTLIDVATIHLFTKNLNKAMKVIQILTRPNGVLIIPKDYMYASSHKKTNDPIVKEEIIFSKGEIDFGANIKIDFDKTFRETASEQAEKMLDENNLESFTRLFGKCELIPMQKCSSKELNELKGASSELVFQSTKT